MDGSQYTGESVVSLLECLVRSAHAKKSRGCDAVSRKQFTDFSIQSILGLANDVTADASSSSGEFQLFCCVTLLCSSFVY